MRIGFLFNHDQVHQVAHALPIATALIEHWPEVTVEVMTTNARLTAEVQRLAARLGTRVPVRQLEPTGRLVRGLASALEWALPVRKLGIYRDHRALLAGFDALVVAEKTSLLLKSRYGLDDLKLIHTRHGAGDRAIGFDRKSAAFDHVLVSGDKIRQRLAADAGVPAERMSVVGYPKFDLFPERPPRLPFADPAKPTVLYNPHPSPHLTSWYRDGRAVLEHFLLDRRYNLIFAPHVMLFHRSFVLTIDKLRMSRPGRIARSILEAPNIHVDLGSAASTDMSYTAAADIYLGDVSSQVYEFLYKPRPCVFLNSHGTEWRGNPNYAHWAAGDVIDRPDGLGAALDRAAAAHARYLPAQRDLFARSFALTTEPSGLRAARAVMAVVAENRRVIPFPLERHPDLRSVPPQPREVA